MTRLALYVLGFEVLAISDDDERGEPDDPAGALSGGNLGAVGFSVPTVGFSVPTLDEVDP